MKAHGIDAKFGRPCGHLFGRVMVGKVGAGGQIHTKQTQARVAGVQMSILDVHKARPSSRLVERVTEIGGALRGVIPWQNEGRQFTAWTAVTHKSQIEQRDGYHQFAVDSERDSQLAEISLELPILRLIMPL
jgi:hypothetical protein